MTLRWKPLFALCVALVFAGAQASCAFAQENADSKDEQKVEKEEQGAQSDEQKTDEPKTGEPKADEKKAEDEGQADDAIELDENLPDDENEGSGNINEALEKAVESELGAAAKENSPEELLNLATELKLNASTLLDLTKVVSLCNKAEALGLDEVNMEFSKQLRLSAQLDRGLAVAQLFMNPELPLDQLPRGWESLRDNAVGDLTAALEENNDVPVAQLSLGRLYMLADKKDEAKKAFEAVFATEEEDAEEYKALAYMFRALIEDDPVVAITFIEKAIELEPSGEPRLYSLYSTYLQDVNRIDEALKQIDKAIELAPEEVAFKKDKALLLVKARRKDEARALFEEATKDSDDNVVAQIEKGQFLSTLGDYDAALEVYSKLAEKFDGPGVYFLRATAYAQKKEYAKAIADVNQALRRDSNMLPALRLKGIIYCQMEKYDDAVRTFEQLRRKSKDDAEKIEATTQIAYALSKKGLYKRASGILKKELEKNDRNVDVLRSLADMELLFGHWDEAAKLYEKILQIVPKDSGVLNNYAWLLATCPEEQYRDGKRALEYAKASAEETFYAAPHILSTLASAYAEIGDFESARSWSQKAVELGEIEEHESLDSLKKELESYKENKPWRETSEIQEEVEESEPEKAKPEEATSNENNGDAAQDGDEKSE